MNKEIWTASFDRSHPTINRIHRCHRDNAFVSRSRQCQFFGTRVFVTVKTDGLRVIVQRQITGGMSGI